MPRSANEFDKIVGRNIAFQRNKKGLSQQALGKAIKTSYQQVQKYENGANRVSAGTLAQISRFLKIPILDFFKDIEGIGIEKYLKP